MYFETQVCMKKLLQYLLFWEVCHTNIMEEENKCVRHAGGVCIIGVSNQNNNVLDTN